MWTKNSTEALTMKAFTLPCAASMAKHNKAAPKQKKLIVFQAVKMFFITKALKRRPQ
jgi:hypothetical protein